MIYFYVKYQQPDILHEVVLFQLVKQIRLSHTMFNVTILIDCES